jgi:hypothetical protein
MANPTRFGPAGVSNAEKRDPMSCIGAMDPTKHHFFFDDFDDFVSGVYTLTETQAGATQALADGDGGRILLTNSAADDDVVSLQKVGESFRWEANKCLAVLAKFQVSDAVQSDILIGLAITDTSPIASVPSDGFHFLKADGAATIIAKSGKDSSYASSGTLATLANATDVELAMVYGGKPRTAGGVTYYDIECYSKSAGVWSKVATIEALAANMCNDEDLTVTIALQNGEAVAKTMNVDYVLVVKER